MYIWEHNTEKLCKCCVLQKKNNNKKNLPQMAEGKKINETWVKERADLSQTLKKEDDNFPSFLGNSSVFLWLVA